MTGGGVPSPALAALAKEGVTFTRLHTTALCSPTRARAATGRNHNIAGTGVITELATGYDGYIGIIPKYTASVAEILRQNGYVTTATGSDQKGASARFAWSRAFQRRGNGQAEPRRRPHEFNARRRAGRLAGILRPDQKNTQNLPSMV